MDTRTVDVAIVGAGTGGLVARRNAKRAGASVVLVDPGPLGTTCARVGCMPSKLLIAAADAAHTVNSAETLGLRTTLEVDGAAVLQRVRRLRDDFVGGMLESIREIEAAHELIAGRARFVDAHTLQVDDHTRVEAKAFVVATGSSPFIPPPFRELGDRLLTNDQIFDLEQLPRSVLVVGAGIIGLELGQALRRLGTEVTLVDLQQIVGPLSDPDCRESARQAFASELDLFIGYQLDQVKRRGQAVEVSFRDADGQVHKRSVERVLVAAGRRPNLAGLDLHKAGVHYQDGPLSNWDPLTAQLDNSHIFVAGDVTGFRPLLHEASDEGRIAGNNAANYPDVLAETRRTPLAIMFTDPQIAVVGRPFSEMHCDTHRVGRIDFAGQGRARVMNVNRGLVRIYGEVGSCLIVGAEMVGPRVEHMAHLLAWSIQKRTTVSEALAMPFYHPVVEEGIRTALRDLQSELRVSRKPEVECTEFGPGT